MKIQGVKGASDILPEEIGTWQALEEKTAQVFERFGFSEIRNPIFEHTELFVRSVGEGTDIVSFFSLFKARRIRSIPKANPVAPNSFGPPQLANQIVIPPPRPNGILRP